MPESRFLDAAMDVADPDDLVLTGARVEFDGSFSPGEDFLVFANQLGIAGSWDGANGALNLTGSASRADYRAALRAVAYVNPSQNPLLTPRSIRITVSDGGGAGGPATITIVIVAPLSCAAVLHFANEMMRTVLPQ